MFGNAGVCHAELQPLTRAVGIEFGDIQTPLTQILVAGDQASANVLWVPKSGADKFVNVFIARVAAHVKGQGLARDRQTANSGFMGKAAHGRAFGRGGVGVEGVNFDVIAKGIGFMAKVFFGIRTLCRQIPAGKAVIGAGHGVPALAGGFFHVGSHRRSGKAVTLARCDLVVGQIRASSALKIERPVFFAAQVGAPGGFAVAAIVQRAPAHGARGVPAGHHFLTDVFDQSPWAADAHRSLRGDAAVQCRTHIDAPTCGCFVDLDHRHAVQIHLFEHFQFGPVAQIPFAKLGKLLPAHAL